MTPQPGVAQTPPPVPEPSAAPAPSPSVSPDFDETVIVEKPGDDVTPNH